MKNSLKKIGLIVLLVGAIILMAYYFSPVQHIADGVIVDRLVVFKARHQLQAYSGERLLVTYSVSLGKNSVGDKQYEGDHKTPEGEYFINDKNPNSEYHKNLGISYPNEKDTRQAKQLGKSPGGQIKIHGLKNGQGFVGKFQRWIDWTNGCIALTDQEVDELYKHTPVGTIIIIKP